MMEQTAQMVAVATASQPMDATTLQLELGSYGIESELDGEFTIAINPILSNAIGGMKILVSAEDAEQARSILAAHAQAKAEERAAKAKTCPKCNHENGEEIRRPSWAGILAVFTLGVFCLLYPWPKYRCPDCHHKWA
jgi:hypothetical protein